jgi:hypothetical protein
MDLPEVRLHCYGSHIDTKVTTSGGKSETKETTVVDFDFSIDLRLSMNSGSGELYTLPDDVMAYRGQMEMETGVSGGPQNVREWAHNYAESPKSCKKFKFYKVR